MQGLATVLMLATQVQTVDLPPGAILCHDERSAHELVAAVEHNPDKLPWLMAGACTRLPMAFSHQVLISEEGPFPQIVFSNGVWKRQRVLVPEAVAQQAQLLQPDVSELGIS